MDAQLLTVVDPVVFCNGALCLRLDGAAVPLRLGPDPVTMFVPGWRPTSAYRGFAAFSILHFANEAGEVAYWIVDDKGVRLGGALHEMEAGAREALCAAAVPVMRRLVTIVLEQPTLALDEEARAFLRLPEDLRRGLAQASAESVLPPPRRVKLDAEADGWNDGWGLGRTHVATLLSMPFQDRLLAAAQDGMLSWPSPVDGRLLTVQGSLCSDDFRFAYRLADFKHGTVCYPIVSDQHAVTIGLYVPALQVVLMRDNWSANWFDIYVPSLSDWLVPLICRFGGLLENYLNEGADQVASIMRGWPATHLGHQLWNELTGIDCFLRSADRTYLPEWIVPGPQTELWGPIDQLFPELQGRVDRSAPNADFAIRNSYETGRCLVRVTDMHVTTGLRARLRHHVEIDPAYAEVRRVITGRAKADAPVILVGLRVENRTLVDLLDFCEELLEAVSAAFPGAIIVLDGHNSGGDGRVIVSHGELAARRPPLEMERQIASHLKRLQAGRDIMVVDTLGASIQTSLAWCDQSDCFFSIWGASLAKYRWACNKPGLVLTSRWNREHRADLHIYDSPMFMEEPSGLAYVDADLVRDVPGAALLVDVGPGQPSFFNFDVEVTQVLSRFIEIIAEHQ